MKLAGAVSALYVGPAASDKGDYAVQASTFLYWLINEVPDGIAHTQIPSLLPEAGEGLSQEGLVKYGQNLKPQHGHHHHGKPIIEAPHACVHADSCRHPARPWCHVRQWLFNS